MDDKQIDGMKIDEAMIVCEIFAPLTRKKINNSSIISVFIAPYQRDAEVMKNMIKNILDGNPENNKPIISKNNYFEVFVLFVNDSDKSQTVTPVDEVLRNILDDKY